jgi:hypothetical protein
MEVVITHCVVVVVVGRLLEKNKRGGTKPHGYQSGS